MRRKSTEERKIPTSISFDQEILRRIEKFRGKMTRSTYVNSVLDEAMMK